MDKIEDRSKDWQWLTELAETGSVELDRREAVVKAWVSMVMGVLNQDTEEARTIRRKLPLKMDFPGCRWEIISGPYANSPPLIVQCSVRSNTGEELILVYRSTRNSVPFDYITKVYAARKYLTATIATCCPDILNRLRPFFDAAGVTRSRPVSQER